MRRLRAGMRILAGCVSLALIANADDIPTDLTGFGLQESRAAEVPGAGVISLFAIVGGMTVATGLGMVDQLSERDFKKLQKKWSESFPVPD